MARPFTVPPRVVEHRDRAVRAALDSEPRRLGDVASTARLDRLVVRNTLRRLVARGEAARRRNHLGHLLYSKR